MKTFWLFFLVFSMCQQIEFTNLQLPDNYSGWIFVIENDSKAAKGSKYHKINKKGVVYIPAHGDKELVQLRLYSLYEEDLSSNVKLFKKSTYSQYEKSKKKNIYLFYYPTAEEANLSDDVWLDIDFYDKYNIEAVLIQQKLEKEGFFY